MQCDTHELVFSIYILGGNLEDIDNVGRFNGTQEGFCIKCKKTLFFPGAFEYGSFDPMTQPIEYVNPVHQILAETVGQTETVGHNGRYVLAICFASKELGKFRIIVEVFTQPQKEVVPLIVKRVLEKHKVSEAEVGIYEYESFEHMLNQQPKKATECVVNSVNYGILPYDKN